MLRVALDGGRPRLDAGIGVTDPEGIAILVGVVLAYGLVRLIPRLIAGPRAYVAAHELKRRLEAGERLLLLDVRSPGEFQSEPGHAPDAVNVPLESLRSRLRNEVFRRELAAARVVAVCRTDSRAAFAVRLLRRAGLKDAQVLSGGMGAWQEEGMPIVRGAGKSAVGRGEDVHL